jgi:hypothetical protein
VRIQLEKKSGISGCGLIEAISWCSYGNTEKNLENPQSGQLVSLPKFEPSTSGMYFYSVTATLICSVVWRRNSLKFNKEMVSDEFPFLVNYSLSSKHFRWK